ncbi:hypothetical protein KY290_036857 [Solanum tuberosum]|uniref:Uncharacterized protein n=1 Tax=Solanum tuberosum TaxID=4113 RepID=A0ABQ7TVK1_SOLTU|nr:hypothetical protein KY289_036328 [Solanum tuberosum]KAH0639594.1 hypothetical protein KY285_036180 [Solanum tuberosum]KAH0738152.1 hypothetical protein KY290_036857 [Solanum tuberosum]
MVELTTMKFDGSRSTQNHIIEITNIAARLQTLGMQVDDTFLVHFILKSLSLEYGPFQINYNTIKVKWDIKELSSILTQVESKLKKQGGPSINLMGQEAGKRLKVKANKFKKNKALDKLPQDAHKELKEFTTIQTTNPNKDFLFMGNRTKAQIKGIWTYQLILETRHHLIR